jgi:FlaA1/EpsC-like NDP-sugar epimerase
VYNRGLYQLLDVMLMTLALVIAQELRFSGDVPSYFVQGLRMFLLPAITSTLAFNTLFGLYRRLWSSAGAYDAVVLGQAALLNIGLLTILTLFWPLGQPVPLSVPIFGGLLYLCASTLVRFRWRFMQSLSPSHGSDVPTKRVLLIGAGRTGETFARHLRTGGRRNEFEVVAFVDDDQRKHGMLLLGVPVIGGRELIPETVALYHIDLIVIAAHAITGMEFRSLLDICNETSAQVKVLPDLIEHLRDQQRTPLLRDVTVQDLLGRRPVEIDDAGCRALLSGATVLVTGAAGSIGSEICRQVLAFEPKRLVMLDNNESGLYDLQIEFAPHTLPKVQQDYIIASITDHGKMTRIFEQFQPTVVFHAAAYKHVPLMEAFPEEAVRVNVGGTYVLTELARRFNVERFVLISTDKAVEPQNVMGATKRVGELLTLSGNNESGTKFTAVRFGNVLNSRGSVVPTFEKQLDMGGPLTVTHPDMRRFFMSIPEAVSLVIQAATLTTGNDLFMLEMGEEISIAHLARRMIRLRGLRVDQDVAIRYTGMRPGEKLREVLSAHAELREATTHPAIYRLVGAGSPERSHLCAQIDDLLSNEAWVDRIHLRQRIFDVLSGLESLTSTSQNSHQRSRGDSSAA